MKDIDIRKILLSGLNRKYENDSETIIIEELGLCQGEVRIDLAVVNGSIQGFEIKSDQDTLKRLPYQIEIYNKTLESVILVVSNKHLSHALQLIPDWWGVIIAEDLFRKSNIKMWRKNKLNKFLDPFSIVQLMWKTEVFEALRKYNLHYGLSNKPRNILWKKLAEHLTIEELSILVRNTLKSRGNWRSGQLQT